MQLTAYVLLLSAVGILIYRADCLAVILYAVVTVEIMWLCYGIFNAVLSILYPLFFSFSLQTVGILFMVMGNLALLFAFFCYRIVYNSFLRDGMLESRYSPVILTPIFMILPVGVYISRQYGNTVTVDGSGKLVNTVNAAHCQMLAMQLLGMAGLFCILYVYKKLMDGFRLQYELSLLEREGHFLHQYVDEAKLRYEKTKSFRHDIKNHITVVKELLQGNKQNEALDYINGMENLAEELSFPCSTNHPALDILIGNKLGLAKSNGIDVFCSLHLPYPVSVTEIDFCIILSNALDNAIHACEKMDGNAEKYIRLTGGVQGDFILLQVENSFRESGLSGPGTGISNIKAVAEKYHGAVNIKTEGMVFDLSVLLIISRHPEDIS